MWVVTTLSCWNEGGWFRGGTTTHIKRRLQNRLSIPQPVERQRQRWGGERDRESTAPVGIPPGSKNRGGWKGAYSVFDNVRLLNP